MKLKLLFSVVFVCTLLTTSYAQINKGTVWLGSNFSYSKQNDRPNQQQIDRESRSVSLLPSFGVAIKENLVLGIFGNYFNSRTKNDGFFIDRKENQYGGGLFIRKYIPVVKRFYMYGEGRLGYNGYKTETYWNDGYQSSTSKPKGWTTALIFTPGISYAITPGIQLEAGFASLFEARYSRMNVQYEPTGYKEIQKRFSAGVNLENFSAFTIGVRFLINKKA
jgi:hypothetical protein